ncbi:sigma-54 dependent transcriptional regulator [Methylocaldum sp.]|uniref:sigma-54-dependent transcriptional regulator n=1 Tax=Methylocaldum sp. TaxID=1969727 RepID=UPI002D3F7A73|nr:sigma-54 dependent transcriptional regulator [Methylocaldum sp.]HYE37815.1 sigma-54 dependent transcriptional regulator [Methylocaldum sp.]
MMQQTDILIVEDDPSLSEALTDTLELAGYRTISAGDGREALAKLAESPVRLVVSDVQMPKLHGLSLLERIKSEYPDVPVLLMTAYGTIENAVQAMQAGACDYLVKPFAAEALVEQVSRRILPEPVKIDGRVVEDPAMKKLFGLAARIAKSDATVLIQGESGTGKEVFARYIHQSSLRYNGPFVAINCAAIPENMLEAELFGYEKGAYTGAAQTVPGKLEIAQGGTVLLDEISEMNLALQAKLLRVLQEREVERLGGRKVLALDIRVLATTNRNLKEWVSRGLFREDLYYRLSVFPLTIPPLRERRGDILPLAEALVRRHWRSGKSLPELAEDAADRLLSYAWPGNVRELDNLIQRALILQSGKRITTEDLAFEDDIDGGDGIPAAPDSETAETLVDGLRTLEEKIILDTLREQNGSRKSTAERLGISERTLRYKLAKLREAGCLAAV